MTDEPGEPVELYRARGAGEAHALRTQLEDAGIPARVENELLQGVVGEVPGGWVTAPRVLVGRNHLDAAGPVLAAFLRPADDPDEPGAGLRCLACRAPMGAADTCPACGWSYAPDPDADPDAAPALAGLAPGPAPGPKPLGPPTAPAPESAPAVPSRALWAEVAAVLAVGVGPYCLAVLPGPIVTPAPYWADTVALIGHSACVAFVTLYLIHRSGEPWERFGLDRPAGSDLLLGFGMLVVAELVWLLEIRLGIPGVDGPCSRFPAGRRNT